MNTGPGSGSDRFVQFSQFDDKSVRLLKFNMEPEN